MFKVRQFQRLPRDYLIIYGYKFICSASQALGCTTWLIGLPVTRKRVVLFHLVNNFSNIFLKGSWLK